MVTLRAMKAEEFSGYREYFVHDYAHEIASNFGHTLEQSRIIAAKELAQDLPQNVSTPEHYLLCIEENNDLIGYLWYKRLDDGETIFILDFVVLEQFRSQGYGRAALAVLEEHLVKSGAKQLKLRVAYKNKQALALYEKLGFNITGYNMAKTLKK
jgi:ribosomal protein S18 acetylase RimI-like enzyme